MCQPRDSAYQLKLNDGVLAIKDTLYNTLPGRVQALPQIGHVAFTPSGHCYVTLTRIGPPRAHCRRPSQAAAKAPVAAPVKPTRSAAGAAAAFAALLSPPQAPHSPRLPLKQVPLLQQQTLYRRL